MDLFVIHPLHNSGYRPNTTLSLLPSVLEQRITQLLQQHDYPPLQQKFMGLSLPISFSFIR